VKVHPFEAIMQRSAIRRFAAPALLGVIVSWIVYALDRRYGSFLADEGYLWYGIQRVLKGEVPIRDFMSYEIGRYYLSAALFDLFDDRSLYALRLSLAVWMAIGLGIGVALIDRAWGEPRWTWLLLPAALLGLWMVPRHKIFDIVVSIVLVAAVARLISKPHAIRFFWLGIATGAAATIGQNHGFYALIASCLTFLLLFADLRRELPWLRSLCCWAIGIAVGYLPVIGFACFVPGYLDALIAAMKYIFVEYKGMNLPLPVPWPWTAHGAGFDLVRFMVGMGFAGVLVVDAAGIFVLARGTWKGTLRQIPIFAAAIIISIPYSDVAFSRADASHLSQMMFPVLIALLTWPTIIAQSTWIYRLLLPGGLLIISCIAILPEHPRFQAMGHHWQKVDVNGRRFLVNPYYAGVLNAVADVRLHHATANLATLAVPMYPGLNAALGQRNPTWEIYPLFPRNTFFQQQEIARIKAASPGLILVSTTPLDGRPEMAYAVTHPLMYQYIQANYDRLTVPHMDSSLQFYLSRHVESPPQR
jgi:hypothetical protein